MINIFACHSRLGGDPILRKASNLIACVILLFCSLTPNLHAYTLAEDLSLMPMGVRAMGMGSAFTALADDASAAHFNPAGLSGKNMQILWADQDISRTRADIDYAHVFSMGSWAYYDRTLIRNGADARLTAWGFGIQNPNGIDYGFNFKHINTAGVGSQFSLDTGVLIRLYQDTRLGLTAVNLINGGSQVNPAFRAGLAHYWGALTLSSDVEYLTPVGGTNSITNLMLGAEYNIMQGFTVRSGYRLSQFTFGLSVGLPLVSLDYAVVLGTVPEYSMAVKVGLDKKDTEYESRQRYVNQKKEYVELVISGAITSGRSSVSLLGGRLQGLDDILPYLKIAAEDPRIEGVVIRLGSLSTGIGTVGIVQELRTQLFKMKKAGKKIIVYLESGDGLNNTYYLASVANQIVIPSGGSVGMLGRDLTIQRLTGLFDKVGISWHVVKSGKYKDSTNPYSKELTPEQRVEIEALVADMYRVMMSQIAETRTQVTANLKLLEQGEMISATRAKDLGFVDVIGYYEDAVKLMDKDIDADDKEKLRARLIPLSYLADPYELGERTDFLNFNQRIAVIDIDGEIVQGGSGSSFLFGGKSVGADTVVAAIAQAMRDDQVKGILLRVNSPGGSAIASEQIYRKLLDAKKKGKKIVVSMGNLAASGGYFVAMAGDRVFANPGSLTGSIGVIGMFPSFERFNQIFGIKNTEISSGKYMDMFSGNRTPTAAEFKMIQGLMNETYEQFLKAVAEGRKLKIEEVRKLAEGKIYTGTMAQEAQLVDELGNFYDAINYLRQLAKIPERYQLVSYQKPEEGGVMSGMREGVRQVLGIPEQGMQSLMQAKTNQMQMDWWY